MSEVIKCGTVNGSFYAIQNHGEYFSFYTVDEMPDNLEPETVEQFMVDHECDGYSVAGTLEQVEAEFAEYFEK